jgi:hypothetical protein
MAAVLPFLETEEFHFPEDTGEGLQGLGALAAANRTDEQIVGASNSELTRLLWTRTLLQQALKGVTFQLFADGGQLKIRLSKPIPAKLIPWQAMTADQQTFSLFSTNSKMRCPTFDLPAGSGLVGGACPAAGPAQSTSIGRGDKGGNLLTTIGGRTVLRLYPDVEYNLARSVCASCYATGGSYGQVSTQLNELVHLAVMQTAVQPGNEKVLKALIDALVWQIPLLPYDSYQAGKASVDASGQVTGAKAGLAAPDVVRERMKRYPKVIRIHSSGDFFSQPYAEMWLEVARQVQRTHGDQIIFWAPTRTSFIPTWAKFWDEADIPKNFTIRPSAYHVGDSAPAARGLASGTSVLTPDDSKISRGEKFDHQCGVYDLKAGNKTCVEALDPDGTPGCRACWVRGDLRVNYVAH